MRFHNFSSNYHSWNDSVLPDAQIVVHDSLWRSECAHYIESICQIVLSSSKWFYFSSCVKKFSFLLLRRIFLSFLLFCTCPVFISISIVYQLESCFAFHCNLNLTIEHVMLQSCIICSCLKERHENDYSLKR